VRHLLFLAVGIGLFRFGCFAVASGLAATITGRESRIAAPNSVAGLLDNKRILR
jgi:hypothetical protein